MKLAEAIMLGAASQPICRDAFIGDDDECCLITAAVRACGEQPILSDEVLPIARRLWPWLRIQAMPIQVQAPKWGEGKGGLSVNSDAAYWIIYHHDIAHAPVEWIAEQISVYEDWIVEAVEAGKLHAAANAKEHEAVTLTAPEDVVAISAMLDDERARRQAQV